MKKCTEALSTVPGTWGGFNIHKPKMKKGVYVQSSVIFMLVKKKRERNCLRDLKLILEKKDHPNIENQVADEQSVAWKTITVHC